MGTTKKRATPDRYDTRWTETQAHFWRSEKREVSQQYVPVSGYAAFGVCHVVRSMARDDSADWIMVMCSQCGRLIGQIGLQASLNAETCGEQ